MRADHITTAVNNASRRWSKERANQWYDNQPWLVGANYAPTYAGNQIEMWQKDKFDPKRISMEMGWIQDIGMNTARVFLHDLSWQEDPKEFTHRVDTFLEIADSKNIKPLIVFFDSVWNPDPVSGPQPEPKKGVHNSVWVQSPGKAAIKDESQHARLEDYVTSVVVHFAKDERILGWDIWNEPCNQNIGSYCHAELDDKHDRVAFLLDKSFEWVRNGNPDQPVTSGMWINHWNDPSTLTKIETIQLSESDIITFHNYAGPDEFAHRVNYLKEHERPLLCTEYMARQAGSTFQAILPIARENKVGMMNWGCVKGRSQTHLPWDSWKTPYNVDPEVWFHDIWEENGQCYSKDEVDFIRTITGAQNQPA